MENHIEEEKIRKIVREEIKKILTKERDKDFLPTTEAYSRLGYRSERHLYHAIKSGLFRIGKEVQDRRGNSSERSKYYFDIPACLERLKTKPEYRSS